MIPRLFVPVTKSEIMESLRVQLFKKKQTEYFNTLEKEFAKYIGCNM